MTFFEVSVLMFGFGLTGTENVFRIAHYIILAVLVIVASLLYFRKFKGRGFSEGFVAGIVFALTGIVLDALITVPLFIKDYGFFVDWFLWVGVIEILVLSGVVGALKK